MRKAHWALLASAMLVVLAATASTIAVAPAAEPSGDAGATTTLSADSSVIRPDRSVAPPRPLSKADQERLRSRLLAKREAVAAKGSGGRAHGGDASAEVSAVDPDQSEAFLNLRNNKNTIASSAGSTLAEPAAANDFSEAMYVGNTYISRSANRGLTWTQDAIPGGPASAPFVCCDPDVVHKPNLDTTFATLLYTNSSLTDGVVRIFVRRSTIAGGNDCTYTIDPGPSSTVLPDYPHIAVSNGFVYLTTNNIGTSGWAGAQIRRFNATQMSNCQSVSTNTVTYTGADGQRVLTPVEGATTNMYFGLNRTSNVFRIIRWPESAAGVSLFDRTLSHGSQFVNPDCRGGTGNFDFIERSTSFSIAGFRLRGAVVPPSSAVPSGRLWFLWNAGPDSSHPQGHVHSALFRESDLAQFTPSHVHNSNFCLGYPAVSSEATGGPNGFFGLSIAAGGRRGGGGTAAQGYVSVDDNDAASPGNRFPIIVKTATGTHNRSDSRYGDYFTVRQSDECFRGWVATNYALLNGTSTANVNARYVEFRSNNLGC